jgi:hypothetical protein
VFWAVKSFLYCDETYQEDSVNFDFTMAVLKELLSGSKVEVGYVVLAP